MEKVVIKTDMPKLSHSHTQLQSILMLLFEEWRNVINTTQLINCNFCAECNNVHSAMLLMVYPFHL